MRKLLIFIILYLPATLLADDPNATPEDVRITPDVVYGHKFGLALTLDMYQPKNPNGAGVIFVNSGGRVSKAPNFYKQIPIFQRL